MVFENGICNANLGEIFEKSGLMITQIIGIILCEISNAFLNFLDDSRNGQCFQIIPKIFINKTASTIYNKLRYAEIKNVWLFLLFCQDII